jgi:hypothetical protein
MTCFRSLLWNDLRSGLQIIEKDKTMAAGYWERLYDTFIDANLASFYDKKSWSCC